MAVALASLRRLACALLALAPAIVSAQTLPAFSGADGAAANVSGGRGGIVYHVTKLNSAIDDPLRNDPGTIRFGLNSANFPPNTPRTIVFDVGGVFYLGRLPQPANNWDPNGNGWDAQSRLTIGGSNVTLAGQTAPGAGVIFMGGGLKPQGNNNMIRNVTVAAGYGLTGWWKPGDAMRAAPGTPEAGTDSTQWFPDNTVYDAMDIAGTNLMIDHVSTLYATDETISMNEVANNITVQYSNISQGQNYPQADAEGAGSLTGHALGSLLEAGGTTPAAISFHHNLYAHLKGRTPQMQAGSTGGGYYDFRNNVFYNWLGTAGSKSGTTFLNLASNFYLSGPGGDSPIGGTNPGLTNASGGTSVLSATATIYRNGNLLDSNKDGDANDGAALAAGGAAGPIWAGGVNTYNGVTDAPRVAYDRVLDYVGANWWNRDGVIDTPDERIINEARTGTGKIVAWADDPWNTSPTEGAEWRALKNTPQTSRAADWDVDGDGMPAFWEAAHGLNPAVADNNGDFDTDGYTNLEEYLNEVAAWPAPAAIVFNGATGARYAQITNWDANSDAARIQNWQPSRYDVAVLHSGGVNVDSVGQHAGTLNIAPAAGDSATLSVTDGWIEVAGVINVGGLGSGRIEHNRGVIAAQSVVLGGVSGGSAIYALSGEGMLRVGTLTKAPAGTGNIFNFFGGTLSADLVTFGLHQINGAIAPGDGAGQTRIMGELYLSSSAQLLLELGGNGAGQFDKIVVEGELLAQGTMHVSLLGSFMPQAGQTFDLLDFTSAAGAFTLDLPQLGGALAWDTSDLLTTGELSVVGVPYADFNGDHLVDGSDFLVWQSNLGLTGQISVANGDADHSGTVDASDLAIWRQQFGASLGLAASSAAPESTCAALIAIAIASLRTLRRQPRRA